MTEVNNLFILILSIFHCIFVLPDPEPAQTRPVSGLARSVSGSVLKDIFPASAAGGLYNLE